MNSSPRDPDPWKENERLRGLLQPQPVYLQMQHAAPLITTALYTLFYGVICRLAGARRIGKCAFIIGLVGLIRAVCGVRSPSLRWHQPKRDHV